MRDVNKVILIGRLGADPIQRHTRNGTPVVQFSVATSRKIKASANPQIGAGAQSSGELDAWEEETQWHKVVVWGRQGETCAQHLRKGHGIYLEGSIRSHRYDAKDGTQRTSFEIHADDVSFLSRPLSAESELQASEEASVVLET